MTFIEPNTPVTPFPKIAVRSITFALLVLASLAVCQSAPAQNLQPRPVAHLISDPVAEARVSRPRRVGLEDGNPVTNVTAEPVTTTSPSLDDATAIERRAFEQTNQARVENGLAPLVWDSELCRMARAHSEQMARLEFFSHETPDGLQLKERARVNGILHFRVIGENIAYNKGYDDPGAFAVERWMISAGHRANILYVGFQASAIGSYVSADGSVYLTQVFIAR
jgi:uncharacterized protein YkwD